MSCRFFFLLIFYPLLFTACVSVNIGDSSQPQKSKVARFKKPEFPFVEFKPALVDHAWKNPKNGNSISYLSECNSVADPSLETIFEGLISSIGQAKTLKKENLTYNGREALRTNVSGQVDGVQSQLSLLVFKKNNCTYILSYIATQTFFGQNIADFEKFLSEFEVP